MIFVKASANLIYETQTKNETFLSVCKSNKYEVKVVNFIMVSAAKNT